MPTTYTHDVYGRKMYRKMPGELQDLIRENGDLYRIGLHGPDILFYHLIKKRVYQTGIRMHKEKAAEFFQRGMRLAREGKDRPLAAYLIGFGCHYLLDSSCHPFVNRMAGEGVVSHTLLEKEFDRRLMLDTGKDPHHFYPSDSIVPRLEYARVIHRAIPEVSPEKICESLKMMKLITNTMVCNDGGLRRQVFGTVAGIRGKEAARKVSDFFMACRPAPYTQAPVQKLYGLYRKSLLEDPVYLEELYGLFKRKFPLSRRWECTYNG